MNLNLKEYTHIPQWIRYPGILLGESYNGICTLADLFVIIKSTNTHLFYLIGLCWCGRWLLSLSRLWGLWLCRLGLM
jgi:hypothetical protein